MGGVIQQSHGNAYNEAVYRMFVDNLGSIVEAPVKYSWNYYTLDVPGSYHKAAQYDFMDLVGNSLKRFDLYRLDNSFPNEDLKGYSQYLIHDATANEWYLFSETSSHSLYELIDKGFFEIISNTVV